MEKGAGNLNVEKRMNLRQPKKEKKRIFTSVSQEEKGCNSNFNTFSFLLETLNCIF